MSPQFFLHHQPREDPSQNAAGYPTMVKRTENAKQAKDLKRILPCHRRHNAQHIAQGGRTILNVAFFCKRLVVYSFLSGESKCAFLCILSCASFFSLPA